MPATLQIHDDDPAEVINRKAGDLDEIEVFNNQVLVAIYDRSEGGKKEIITQGGIRIPVQNTEEDQHQSKVGLLLRMGPRAFCPPNPQSTWFVDQEMNEGDWVVFRASDGWTLTLVSKDERGHKQELKCRMVDDTNIRAKIESPLGPDRVY